jgi:hypothetical protein
MFYGNFNTIAVDCFQGNSRLVILSVQCLLCDKTCLIFTLAIDTPGGNLSLKIKSKAQQITLKPNIMKVKIFIS